MNLMKALIITWENFQDQEVVYPYYRIKEETDDVKTTLAPTEIVKQAECLLDKLKSLISKLFSKLK